jgi:hypothetical protein
VRSPIGLSASRPPAGCRACVLLVLSALVVPAALVAQQATLSGPSQVSVGAPLAIAWTGPAVGQDFISVDAAGAPESSYGSYVYANAGTPAQLTAPDTPGRYVVRYHSGTSGYAVLASHPIEVVDVTATLTVPGSVEAGAPFKLTWTGPGNSTDFISIDPAGAPERDYGDYAYATEPSITLTAPDQAGQYLVRYHMGGSYRVIGQAPVTVGGVSASVTAAVSAAAGSELEVSWTGPANSGDFLSIDSVGSPESDYGNYGYAAEGSPLTIRVPERPGAYELRYHTGSSYAVIGRAPLEVLANTATVSGPPSAAGGSEFAVPWTGPDNSGDYVTIVPAGASNREYLTYAYTRAGTPAALRAPLEPGNYEIRYMTGGLRDVLASAPISITPGVVPGQLRIIADAGAVGRTGAIEVILDASGSMLQRIAGERRIEIARDALTQLVTDIIPAGTPFALRVFGHREVDSCRTDLEIPLSALNPASAAAAIGGVQAMNLARTPIGASLRLVRSDLANATGTRLVVLVTDGEETCDDDPLAAIAELRGAGIEVRVNVVGFAIDEHQLREQFESWARAGGGLYTEADDREELERAMAVTIEVPFEVRLGDEVVATGVVNEEPLSLAPGSYRVRVLDGSTPSELSADVASGETTTVGGP